jgi:hypothetical protein
MGMKNITQEMRKLYSGCMIALRPAKPNEPEYIESQVTQNDPYSHPFTSEEIQKLLVDKADALGRCLSDDEMEAITSDRFRNYILSGEKT